MAEDTIEKVTPKKVRWYGYIPDHKDQRDKKYSLSAPSLVQIKEEVDLANLILQIKDQGDLGACTAHAITSAYEALRTAKGLKNVLFSRLQVYFDERRIEGTIDSDSGAQPRDGIKSLTKAGVAIESLWPYDTTKFTEEPPQPVYDDAAKNLVISYTRLDLNVRAVKAALSSNFPVICGISVYESFESDEVAKTGQVPMPGPSESMLGGHCVLIVGYKDGKFKILNSWGPNWGDHGYFWVDEAYIGNENLTSDLWIIEEIQSAD